MSSNKKTLKMERLSPIPALERTHRMSDSSFSQRVTPPSHNRPKDAYAIETTSSPEFVKMPVASVGASSVQKPRRYRSITRSKVSKKSSTPLSGLISRKTVSGLCRQTLQFADSQSSPISLNAAHDEGLTPISQEELPLIDDYSPQKPTHSLRHSEIISPCTVFPQKHLPSTSSVLDGIVNTKLSNLNRSLNDSILVLQEAEDPSDDEISNTSLSNLPKVDDVSIESFESPRKSLFVLKEQTASVLKSGCKPEVKDTCLPMPVGKMNFNCAEMCGSERKNRKRALHFDSSFVMPIPTAKDGCELSNLRRSPSEPAPSLMRDQSPSWQHTPEVANSMVPINDKLNTVTESSSVGLLPSYQIDSLETQSTPVLEFAKPLITPHVEDAHLTPQKRTESPEINSVEGCPSDCESLIENTPTTAKYKNSDGFTAYLKIENDSPPSDVLENPEIVEIDEMPHTAEDKCNLNFVVISHDTSDESDVEKTCDLIQPTIDDRHSPVRELSYSKRPIQSFETPSKTMKPFSEAVNIGAFGSPDSNDENEVFLEEENLGDVEPSTTQEYVEESEQVRPTKRRKKGSLLERVRGVIAKVDASNALFDYELKCGLRPLRGKFVSAPLVILTKFGETSSLFLLCKPLKYCRNSSPYEDLSSFVMVHVNKLPPPVAVGSVVLLHFPLNITYCSNLHFPCVLAGNQIVHHPTESIDIHTIDLSALSSIPLTTAYSKPLTSFRTFSSVQIRTFGEASLCQNLIEDCNLHLTILHVTKLFEESVVTKMSVLCRDEEFQFGWLTFACERDIKRAAALETLQVLTDGSQIQTTGFAVVDRTHLDRKSKHLISYCTNNAVQSSVIFFVLPNESNWVISSTESPSEVKKVPSLFSDILAKKTLGCRYLVEVRRVEQEPHITLTDSAEQTIGLVIGKHSSINLHEQVPFFLDGAYFYDGKLYSDEHTRVLKTNVVDSLKNVL